MYQVRRAVDDLAVGGVRARGTRDRRRTTEDNRASQLVLERSGFELAGGPDDVLLYTRTAE